jgi:hypothetical protein
MHTSDVKQHFRMLTFLSFLWTKWGSYRQALSGLVKVVEVHSRKIIKKCPNLGIHIKYLWGGHRVPSPKVHPSAGCFKGVLQNWRILQLLSSFTWTRIRWFTHVRSSRALQRHAPLVTHCGQVCTALHKASIMQAQTGGSHA